jgi:hypothetical protein
MGLYKSYLQSNSPLGIQRFQAYNLRRPIDSHLVLTFSGYFSKDLGVT